MNTQNTIIIRQPTDAKQRSSYHDRCRPALNRLRPRVGCAPAKCTHAIGSRGPLRSNRPIACDVIGATFERRGKNRGTKIVCTCRLNSTRPNFGRKTYVFFSWAKEERSKGCRTWLVSSRRLVREGPPHYWLQVRND